MSRYPTRLSNLFSRKRSEATRKNPRRRSKLRNRIASNWSQVESLESRAMLAVTAFFENDIRFFAPTVRNAGTTWTNSSSLNGVLTIQLNANNDQVFMRVVNSGNRTFYEFAEDANFQTPIAIDGRVWDATGNLGGLGALYAGPNLDVQDNSILLSANGLIDRDTVSRFTDGVGAKMRSGVVTKDPTVNGSGVVTAVGTTNSRAAGGLAPSELRTIYVRAASTALTGLGFTTVGGTLDANDGIQVDFRGIEDSTIRLGGSLTVANGGDRTTGFGYGTPMGDQVGGIFLAAQRVEINSPVSSLGDVVLMSADQNSGNPDWVTDLDPDAGIFINAPLTVGGGGALDISLNRSRLAVSDSQAVSAAAGGRIGNLNVTLTDSSATIGGKIAATTQIYNVTQTTRVGAGKMQSISTVGQSGQQLGSLDGDLVVMTLFNDNDNAAGGIDSSVDLQGTINRLRFDTLDTANQPRNVDFKLVNTAAQLNLDTVFSSQGRIEIQSVKETGGTFTGKLNLTAAITTVGDLSFVTGEALLLATPVISTGGGISLTSRGDSVSLLSNVSAFDDLAISSDANVSVASRAAGQSIEVASKNGSITVGGTDVASRLEANAVTLRAKTGITAGIDADLLTVLPSISGGSTGGVDVTDLGAGPALELREIRTGGGNFKLSTERSITATLVNALTGDIDLITEGTAANNTVIDLGTVVGDKLTLRTVTLNDITDEAEDGGQVTGDAPTVNEIDWTSWTLAPAVAIYQNAPKISARLLSSGDISFNPTGAVELVDVSTFDGDIEVNAAAAIIATRLVAGNDNGDANGGGVTLAAASGSVTLGTVSGEGLTVEAAEGILDDGVIGTTAITAATVSLTTGTSGVSSPIGGRDQSGTGGVDGRLRIESPAAEDAVQVTIERAAADGAVDASDVFLFSDSALELTITATDSVTVVTTGSASNVLINQITVTAAAGDVVVEAGGNITTGMVQVAPTALVAGAYLGSQVAGVTFGYGVNLAANVAATCDSTSDFFTSAVAHNLAVGDMVRFVSGQGNNNSLTSRGITLDITYYVSNVQSATAFQLATGSATGPTLNITSDITGGANAAAITPMNASVFSRVGHGLLVGDRVVLSANNPTGFDTTTAYFVKTVNGEDFTLSLTNGGPAVAGTGQKTGVTLITATNANTNTTFTATAHGLSVGERVRFTNRAPSNGSTGDLYYVATAPTANTFTLEDANGNGVSGLPEFGLNLGDVRFDTGSSITLTAGRLLVNADANNAAETMLDAEAVSLSSALDISNFNVSALDTVERLAASVAGAGQISMTFERSESIILSGVTSQLGNITITNDGDGAIQIGIGGVVAGAALNVSNSVSITAGGDIGLPDDVTDQGKITSRSIVTLTAGGDIAVNTAAAQIQANAGSTIEITEDDNVTIGAGGLSATDSVSLTVTAGDVAAGTGRILTSDAEVTASGSIAIKTNVTTLSATSTNGGITVTEASSLSVGAGGIEAAGGAVSLTLTTGELLGAGSRILANSLDVALLQGGRSINLATSASAISASTFGGTFVYSGVTFAQATDRFTLPVGSIVPSEGTTLRLGTAVGADMPIGTDLFVVNRDEANRTFQLASQLGGAPLTHTADVGSIAVTSTRSDITITNDRSFAIGVNGIKAGINANLGKSDVAITATSGSIGALTGGVPSGGRIFGDNVTLSAAVDLLVNTQAGNNGGVMNASAGTGNLSIANLGSVIVAESVNANAGTVTIANNDDVDLTGANVQGTNVSITVGGIGKNVILDENSITATTGGVTVQATGKIEGNVANAAEITGRSVTLRSIGGGDVEASVDATTLAASASGGVGADVAVKLITGQTAVFLNNSGTNVTTLSAAGDVSLTVEDRAGGADPDVVVIAAPVAGGGNVEINTAGTTSLVVSNAFATGFGSLARTVADLGTITNAGGGDTGIVFATTVTGAISLATPLVIGTEITLDATRRINVTSGAFSTGGQLAIDGSAVGTNDGITFDEDADGSVVRGFRFYGFANGSGLLIDAGCDNVTVSDSTFGVTASQRVVRNSVGLEILGNSATVTNSTFGGNDIGLLIGTGVTGTTVTGSMFGTNASRASLPNLKGVQLSNAREGNSILNGYFAYNDTGVEVFNVTGTAGSPTVIDNNEFVLNGGTIAIAGEAVLVNGNSQHVVVTDNTVTRGSGNGIVIAGTANNVTVGQVGSPNFVGTNSRGALGLGNRRNGVSITSTGLRNTVVGNVIAGNGLGNVAGEGNGVAISAAGTLANVANAAAALDVTAVVVSSGTDEFTKVGHGLVTGDAIRFIAGRGANNTSGNVAGAAPNLTGIAVDTTYYVIRIDANNFKIASSAANADVGTAIDVLNAPAANSLAASRFGVFAKPNHGLANGDTVIFTAGAPAGFIVGTAYHVVASSQNGFSLAATNGGSAMIPTAVSGIAALSFNGPSVTVSQNTIRSNKQAGIYAAGTAWAAITGNTIESNQYGVNAQGASKLTIGGAFADTVPGGSTVNFIRNNTLFGVNVLNTAFAQIGFNSMSGNRRGGISSSAAAPAILSVTYNGTNLVVTLSAAPTASQVIHLYTGATGAAQGLTYLGRFTSAQVGPGNTLTLTGLSGIRVGTAITATVSDSSGAAPTTSPFARLVTAKRAR